MRSTTTAWFKVIRPRLFYFPYKVTTDVLHNADISFSILPPAFSRDILAREYEHAECNIINMTIALFVITSALNCFHE